jgi:hypothetical protein
MIKTNFWWPKVVSYENPIRKIKFKPKPDASNEGYGWWFEL